MIRLGFLIIIIVASVWPNLAEAKRVALVIGNSAYVNTSSLPHPTNDANVVAEAARKAGFDDVVVALDLTISSFQRELRTFAQKSSGADVAMIYYAGHGIEGQGKNWLLPIDAELKTAFDLPDQSIGLDRIVNSVSGAATRVVVLDACRDQAFGNSWASGTKTLAQGLVEANVDDVLIIYAAAPGQTAPDGDGFNSPFALSFAERLPQPGLALQQLGGTVRDDVLSATSGSQRPFISAGLAEAAVYLVSEPKPRPVAVANPEAAGKTSPGDDRTTMDALMWRGVSSAGTLTAYQAYIKEFPSGLFADLANMKIDQLRDAGGDLSGGEPNSDTMSLAEATTAQSDVAFVPPPTAEPDLPALPPTPVLPAEGYPDCRESYKVFEMPFDKADDINACTVKLDQYYSDVLTPFRARMTEHQQAISQLYTDKVGGNMQYSPATQASFYDRMMREHADSDPDGVNLAAYRAAEARYQQDREYLQDRFCFNTGCGGYPVPEFDVEKALAQPKVRMDRSAGDADSGLALAASTGEAKKERRKKKKKSGSKKCKAARKGGGLFGSILGGVVGDAAGLGSVGTLISSGLGAVIGAEIACQLDEKEQEKAAEATLAVVEKEEVGAIAEWQSPTRAGVSGSSMITALNAAPDGRRCLSITDVAIIDGEETKIAKQMCRGPEDKNYTLVA